MTTELDYGAFDALTFDCYGTLIDWETGICDALAPLLARAGVAVPGGPPNAAPSQNAPTRNAPSQNAPTPTDMGHAGMGLSRSGVELSRDTVLQAFARLESRQQETTPDMPYPDLLAEVHGQLAAEWDVARDPAEDAAFGASIAAWPPFPDTIEALRYLKQHFRLIILSNVDRTSFQATNQRLGVAFDAICTAQDIGSYKPDHRNFRYLLDRLREQGVPREKLLHVAQSLFHDHVPANALGLASAWIDRRQDAGSGGATAPVAPGVRYDFRFPTLGALAEAHRAGG
jgi:2-haloalkanoic acid dehalogenase type II